MTFKNIFTNFLLIIFLGQQVQTGWAFEAAGIFSQKLTSTSTITFAHNSLNQLTEWTKTGKNPVTFEYDPLGRRITKTVGTTVYQYTWDGAQLIEVRNSSGTVQRKFVYGTGITRVYKRDVYKSTRAYKRDVVK